MKNLVFDSSSVITLVTNNLLDILKELKKRYKGEFYISNEVKKEIIDIPMKGRKYKFESLMLADYLVDGHIKFFKQVKLDNKTKCPGRFIDMNEVRYSVWILRNVPEEPKVKVKLENFSSSI